MVALQGQRETQALEVVLRELAVPGFGARRRDDSLDLEETELAGREIRELGSQPRQDLADAEEPGGR